MSPDKTSSTSLSGRRLLILLLVYLFFIVIVYVVTFFAFSGMGISNYREQSIVTVIAAILGAIVAIFIDRVLRLFDLG